MAWFYNVQILWNISYYPLISSHTVSNDLQEFDTQQTLGNIFIRSLQNVDVDFPTLKEKSQGFYLLSVLIISSDVFRVLLRSIQHAKIGQAVHSVFQVLMVTLSCKELA